MNPDILARIRLHDVGHVHRKELRPPYFSCPFRFEGESFDCRILLEAAAPRLVAGAVAVLPIAFLNPPLVKDRLRPGSKFLLWDLGDFAEGVVIEILNRPEKTR